MAKKKRRIKVFNLSFGDQRIGVWFEQQNEKGKPKETICNMRIVQSGKAYTMKAKARCNYDAGDCFDKGQGRRTALDRLLKSLPLTRRQRIILWREYYRKAAAHEKKLPGAIV